MVRFFFGEYRWGDHQDVGDCDVIAPLVRSGADGFV